MHNLFGDTEAVDVFVFPDGSVEVELSDEGDTVADMLQYVQLDPNTLLTQFRDQVKNTGLDERCSSSSSKSSRRVCTATLIWKTSDLCPLRSGEVRGEAGLVHHLPYSLEPV
jgi:hypothetical protein